MEFAKGYIPQESQPEPLLAALPPGRGGLVGLDSIPADHNADRGRLPYLDQGPLSSCVSNVIQIQAIQLWLMLGIVNPPRISRLQNYFKSRARHNAKDQDLGTYPVHSYDSVQDGFCDERFWPYDIGKVYTAPDANALRHSFDQSHEGLALRDGTKLSTWEHKQLRLSDDGDEREQQSKQVVASDLGVAVGLDVDQGFQDYTNGIWRYRGPSKGRHYVLITRFTPYAAYCRSSWGARYGEEGGIWVAWSEIRNPRLCTDPMVLLRLPLTSDSMA